MKQILTMTCPYCGADMDYEEGKEQMYCQYCGKKVLLVDNNTYNINYSFKNIDEPAITKSENEKIIKLKQLEMVEKIDNKNEYWKIIGYIIALLFFVIGCFLMDNNENASLALITAAMFVVMLTSLSNSSDYDVKEMIVDEAIKNAGLIQVKNIHSYYDINFSDAEKYLRSLGFCNIVTIPLHDLRFYNKKDNYKVNSITANGKSIRSDVGYPKETSVVISYHSR